MLPAVAHPGAASTTSAPSRGPVPSPRGTAKLDPASCGAPRRSTQSQRTATCNLGASGETVSSSPKMVLCERNLSATHPLTPNWSASRNWVAYPAPLTEIVWLLPCPKAVVLDSSSPHPATGSWRPGRHCPPTHTIYCQTLLFRRLSGTTIGGQK